MPTFYKTDWTKGKRPTPEAVQAGVVAFETFEFALTGALAVNDVIEMGILPANNRIVDAMLDSDDLDTGGTPAITLDVGIMSGEVGDTSLSRTVGTELYTASTVARAGGMERTSKAQRLAPTNADRSIGVKVAAGPAAGATTGKIRLTVFYGQ